MKPTVGRIIHVQAESFIPCRAAIVTGVNHNPSEIFVAVFRNRGDLADRAVLTDDKHWHDPRECPEEISDTP